MPSLGSAVAVAVSDYETDLRRIEAEVSDLAAKAFTTPLLSAETTLYVYRLYARSSLNGNLKELRHVESQIDRAITCLGPAEDLCLLKANLDFKLHRLKETKEDLGFSPTLAGRRQGQMLLADVAFQEGHYKGARAALEALASEEPSWDVLARIAHIEFKMGDSEKADQLYLQAEDELTAKEMRSFAWIELQRGLLDLSRGRVKSAVEHYECAERAYSGYWLTAEHLADALNSAAHYEQVLSKISKPEVAQKLGELYQSQGDRAHAESLFQRALANYLESAERGEVHYYHHLTEFFADAQPNAKEAVKWAQKDLALRDNFNTRTALAWALHLAGENSNAINHIERALNSGVQDASIFKKAALIFEASGDHHNAHTWEHKAAALNPLGIQAHTH